jgi:hypothetical protein
MIKSVRTNYSYKFDSNSAHLINELVVNIKVGSIIK